MNISMYKGYLPSSPINAMLDAHLVTSSYLPLYSITELYVSLFVCLMVFNATFNNNVTFGPRICLFVCLFDGEIRDKIRLLFSNYRPI
jgi:hypothetical protein